MPEVLEVRFPSGEQECAAWLYLPDGGHRAPVVVMGHGLGAIRQMRLDAFAQRFSAAGYACLVFDYRHFGDSGGEPRQLLDITEQLIDWQAAIDYARKDSRVGDQIVLWGSSFGGGHVLRAAARDGHVDAVISQCPFTNGLASTVALGVRSATKVAILALRDLASAARGQEPVMVPLVGPPGSAALMTAPDAEPGYLRLLPAGVEFRNEAAARFGLHITRYFPGRSARRVSAPILFCICDSDTVAPAGPTKRYARKAPLAEVKLYPQGHFEIYVGDGFERVVADQLDFLRRRVGSAS